MSNAAPSNPYSQPSDPEPASKSGIKRSNTWIYIGIIGLLLVANIYLYFNRDGATEQKIVVTEEKLQQADSARILLQAEYNAALARLDELTGKNAQLDKLLKDSKSELQKAKSRIQEILDNKHATGTDIEEARALISKLNLKIAGYEKQITTLKKKNVVLTKERDSVIQTNEVLQEQVDLGKVLHASNIRLTAIDLRKGGRKERMTTRAKRVDLLRILFDIDENRLADDGMKELNIRIVDPEENLLSNIGLGSGSFVKADGEPINYSVSKTIHLQKEQPVQDIMVDWQQSAEYTKGAYLVEVYHRGYLIGKGTATLR